MASMTVKEKLELEALGVDLGEGPWEYRREDLDHAKQVLLDLQADPEYAKIEGGVEIAPPRWRPGSDGFYDPNPVFLVRYKTGFAYAEAQFPAKRVYEPDFDQKIERAVWSQFPNLRPAIMPPIPPKPTDPVDPVDPDPVDPVDPDPIPIDPRDKPSLETFRQGFQVDPKIFI